ncbi:ubiquitin-conjugating enzyme E2 U-like protein, partial [Zopfochytrium polystomum]
MAVSRANLLLQKQLYKIETAKQRGSLAWGIEAGPVLNDIFCWEAKVLGLRDTPWEGGIFKLRMQFSEAFDQVPPQVTFLTVPFHPNVEMETGRPCWAALDDLDEWDPDLSIVGMLTSLQFLLANPTPSNAVNDAACSIFLQSPRLYDQLARDCVLASQRVEAGLQAYP